MAGLDSVVMLAGWCSVSQHPRQRAHRDPGLGGTTHRNVITQAIHLTRGWGGYGGVLSVKCCYEL